MECSCGYGTAWENLNDVQYSAEILNKSELSDICVKIIPKKGQNSVLVFK